MSMETLMARLQYNGGNQLERIKLNKLRSFQAALKNDYQTRIIKTQLHSAVRCLINTNNIKADYDKKDISVEFSSGLSAGDTFECLDDGSHWMIYLPMLTETAYLRSEIIRCRYTLDVDGIQYWIYFQGPTETDIRWMQKSGINGNELNLSGTVYIKKDKHTENFFSRFKTIKIEGQIWEVQVVDKITVPGIIELELQEYYNNPPSELPEVVPQGCHEILGRETVEQDNEYGYRIRDSYYRPDYTWKVLDNPRVELLETLDDGHLCKIKVHDGAVRTFKILYGNGSSGYEMVVNIAREFKGIVGPTLVYPYDIVEYCTPVQGEFTLASKDAHIKSQDGTSCLVEITTGKKGSFTLYFNADAEEYENTVSLDVTIGSL